MYQNTIYICISWYSIIFWFPVKKILMSAKLKRCVTWFIYFLDPFWVRYNWAKFHHCRICVTDFRERRLFAPPASPIHEQPRKSPSWIGLKCIWHTSADKLYETTSRNQAKMKRRRKLRYLCLPNFWLPVPKF